ncbi:MAG: ribonuclease HI [Myxococcales bacterium]|nr:ribonuclease HI [Myxococcales bacterium]
MPWIEAELRGQRVFARARADGSLAADASSRVEIRYKAQDARAYRASLRNLLVSEGAKLHPDEVCKDIPEPAGAAQPPSSRTRQRKVSSVATPADAWIAYTDGACSGNPGPAGSGVVLVSPDGKMHEGLEYLGEGTNNVAELTGILRALEWIPQAARAIVVHTDSQYAIGVLQKGWKAKTNQELVARTRQLVEGRGARLLYVPGHQGVSLNERADELAREAIRTRARKAPSLG